jgi:uncharacterized membrane protein YdbT with pleckstrin-like domain
MTIVNTAKEYAYAWIIKIWVLMLGLWFIVGSIYLIAKAFGVDYVFVQGMANRVSFLFLVIISHIIVALVIAAVMKLLSKGAQLTITDKGVTMLSGLIGKKETTFAFPEIRDAHTVPGPFALIDNLFGVSNIIIHGPSTLTMAGVRGGDKVAREIADRANAAKKSEQKEVSQEQLLKEIDYLREEVKQLRAAKAAKEEKTARREEGEKRKPRFLKPFEEGI